VHQILATVIKHSANY